MKSWKTTLGGILGAIGTTLTQLPYAWGPKSGAALITLGFLLTGGAARDNNVPSEAVPGAIEKQTSIVLGGKK